MSVIGDERVIEKNFIMPTSVGGVPVVGAVKIKQRLMVSSVRKIFGKEIYETSWVDVEVVP